MTDNKEDKNEERVIVNIDDDHKVEEVKDDTEVSASVVTSRPRIPKISQRLRPQTSSVSWVSQNAII